MAITVDVALAGPFTPNGVTVQFDFNFKAASTSELKVYRKNTDGSLTTLSPGLYTVVLASDGEGGSVIFTAPPATTGGPLYIEGNPLFTQSAVFTNNGFLPETINPAIDRSALRDIWLRDRLNRTISVPFGETGFGLPTAADRANDVFTFDNYGAPAMVPKTTFKGDKGDPGGNAMAIGAWRDFETFTIPVGLDMVITTDTLAAGSATGTASARYKLDPEQTAYPTALQTWITASIAAGTPSATAYAAADDFMKYWRRKSANNRWFMLAEPEPSTAHFGCPGDGAQSVAVSPTVFTVSTTGTDVFQNFQNFIDYCVYIAKLPGRISGGTHRVSRGLQHGYGNTYVGGWFCGPAQAYAGQTGSFPGAAIVCDTDEDPILNISGDRDVLWEKVTFRGPYDAWQQQTQVGFPSADPRPSPTGQAHPNWANYDMLDSQSWIAPYLRTSQDGRFNPAAAVTLGAYDGGIPTAGAWGTGIGYAERDCVQANGNVYTCIQAGASAASGTGPSGTGASITDNLAKWRYLGPIVAGNSAAYVAYRQPYRPAWMLNPTQSSYGNVRYGSFCTFRDCFFVGMPTLFCSKPGNNSLQDDFLAFERCNFVYFNFAISAGNNQLRNFSAQACNFGIGNCNFVNLVHGTKTGSFKACHINDCGLGASVDIFRLNASYGCPIVFTACYCEGQFRLGQILGGGQSNQGPQFIGCEWNFSGVHAVRGIAPRQLYSLADGDPNVNESSPPQSYIPTTFIGCKINVDSVFTCYLPGASFINTQIYSYGMATITKSYLAFVSQATAGGLIMTGLEYGAGEMRLSHDGHNLDTNGYAGHWLLGRGYNYGTRALCIPFAVRSVRASNGVAYEEIPVPHDSAQNLTKSSYTVTYTTGLSTPPEINIIVPGFTQANHADTLGFGTGSVVIDGQTGTVFGVRSFDTAAPGGTTIIAVALNNYNTIAGVCNFMRAPTTNTGNLTFRAARIYTPTIPLYGDFTANVTATGTNGSPNLTSVVGTLTPGQVLTHANIPAGTTVLSVQGSTAVMTANATGAVSGSIVAATTIANVGTNAGTGTTIQDEIPVGDFLQSPVEQRSYAPATTTVSSRTNGSPGSITLSANATRTQAGVRLAFFRRPGPANV